MIYNRPVIVSLIAIGLSLSSVAQAEAPVVDLSSNAPSTSTSSQVNTSGMSSEQRIQRLENIVAAQNSLGTVDKVNALQQQVQTLQGQVDNLQHQLAQIQSQMKQQYSDLDQRLVRLESGQKGAAPATGDIVNEHKAYQKAYGYIKVKNYSEANKALLGYIKQYPQGDNVPNAYFWLGEVFLAQGNIPSALDNFNTVASKYASSNKAPDALLKLGTINAELGKTTLAKSQLNQVIKKYPNDPAAKLAKAQLAKH